MRGNKQWFKVVAGLGLVGLTGLMGCGSGQQSSSIPMSVSGNNGQTANVAAYGTYDANMLSKTTYISRSQTISFLLAPSIDNSGAPEVTFTSVGDITNGNYVSGMAKAMARITGSGANGAIIVSFTTVCTNFGTYPFNTHTTFRLDLAFTNNGNDFDPTQSRLDTRDCGFSQGIPSPEQWLSWGSPSLYVRFGDILGKR